MTEHVESTPYGYRSATTGRWISGYAAARAERDDIGMQSDVIGITTTGPTVRTELERLRAAADRLERRGRHLAAARIRESIGAMA